MFTRAPQPPISSSNPSSVFPRLFWLPALFLLTTCLLWVGKTNAQNAAVNQVQANEQSPQTLEAGKQIERELAGGQSHTYQITLAEAQFFNVVVEQRCIDVAVTLISPGGEKVAQVDSPNGEEGPESLTVITGPAGTYRLEISSIEQNAKPGRYTARIVALRGATEKEIALASLLKPHVEQRLVGGQAHNYEFNATAGDYLEITAEQRGIDVELLLFGPEDRKLAMVDSPNGADGPETIILIIENSGKHRLTVHSLEKNATPGLYIVTMVEQRPPSEKNLVLWEAQKLHDKALRLREQKTYQEAISAAERALTLRGSVRDGSWSKMDDVLNNLERLYFLASGFAEGYERAEALYQRYLTAYEKEFGPENRAVGYWLYRLAALYHSAGEYKKVEPLYRRLIPIYDNIQRCKSIGMNHPRRILANLYNKMGDYVGAELLYRQVLKEWEDDHGPDNIIIGVALSEIANIRISKGDFGEAVALAKRSLAIREKAAERAHADPGTNIDAAFSLQSLGYLYARQGNYAEAENYLMRSIAIMEKPEINSRALPNTLAILGTVYLSLGDVSKAERTVLRALELSEKQYGPNHPELAGILTKLSRIYSKKKDYGRAEELLRRALSIYQRAPGLDHPGAAGLLRSLSALRLLRGDSKQAVTLLSQSIEIGERVLSHNIVSGSERQKLAFLSIFSNDFNLAASLHAQAAPGDADALRLAFLTALLRKGRSLDAMVDFMTLARHRSSKDDQRVLDRLLSARTRYSELALRGAGNLSPNTYKQQLAQLQEQMEKLEAELGARNIEFQSQPITIEAIQRAIPDQTALVEFARYTPFGAESDKNGADRYVVYVLNNQGEPSWMELGGARQIDQLVEAFRRELSSPQRRRTKVIARSLDDLIMRPVRKLLGGTTKILLSPDGALNFVPFAALVDEGGKYLVSRYSFTYLASGRDLLRLRSGNGKVKEIIALANPDFGANNETMSAERDIKPMHAATKTTGQVAGQDFSMGRAFFSPLPGTEGEAAALQSLLPGAQILTKGLATETALKQVSHPGILHIATHGYFLAKETSGTAEVADDWFNLQSIFADSVQIGNPYLRSGLALAGANLHKSGNDDGILTALEAAGLDLWGTKLVVLSACNTGVGDVRNGDGVYGLRRALVLAGSESQMMSLWKVSDQGTKELMVEYYKRLLGGEGRGEALRQVQLGMLKNPKRSHPFYWASFIQSGEWANLDGKR